MPYIKLKLPPGVYRNGTEYQTLGRWYDANGVRFFEGSIRPIGGTTKLQTVTGGGGGSGAASDRFAFMGLGNPVNDLLFVPDGSVEAIDRAALLNLYTASGASSGVADTVFNGTPRKMLAWNRIAGASSVLAVGTENAVYAFIQGTNTEISPPDLVTGDPDSTITTGVYGYGSYGIGPYGVGDKTQAVLTEATSWQFDTFGQYLVAVSTADGRCLYWDADTDNDLVEMPGAPIDCSAIVVTPERFVVALGANGDPRLVAWASQETLDTWTTTGLNTAGDHPLPTTGRIMCGRLTTGKTLIFTDVDLWAMQYVGGSLVYGFHQIQQSCGIISRHAVAMVAGGAVWMGLKGFFLYDGVRVLPLPCDVNDHVFSDFNITEAAKVWAMPIAQYKEVWFFYPSAASAEPNRYVTWNYDENHWSIGVMTRTAGVDRGPFEYPMMADETYVYHHERGQNRAVTAHLESGPVEIDRGDRVMMVRQLIPDERNLGDVDAYLYGRLYPTATETASGPHSTANPTNVRLTARQVRLRLEEQEQVDWRIGDFRLEVVPGGNR